MTQNEDSAMHQEREVMSHIPLPQFRVNRVEVIDHYNGAGRAYTFGPASDAKVEVDYQDGGQTMKIFISKK